MPADEGPPRRPRHLSPTIPTGREPPPEYCCPGSDSGTDHMTYTLEISDELRERLDDHLEEGESYEELITELVALYETDGAFLQEGYSE